jgi:hypothetical protein
MGFSFSEVEYLIDKTIESNMCKDELLDNLAHLYDGYIFSESATSRLFNSNFVLGHILSQNPDPEIYNVITEDMESNMLTDYQKLKSVFSLVILEDDSFLNAKQDMDMRCEAVAKLVDQEGLAERLIPVFMIKRFPCNEFL